MVFALERGRLSIMITLGQTDQQVAVRLPPAVGQFRGWKWQDFYNAILHVLQNQSSQEAYYRAYAAIRALPPQMRMTPQVLTAAWARFTRLFPGWENWDYNSAYEYMKTFLEQSGRLVPGDQRQWWTVEEEWQAMEVPKVRYVARQLVAGRY